MFPPASVRWREKTVSARKQTNTAKHGKANVHGMREDATKPVLHRTSLMHPKTLEFLCVDELVAATVAYQLSVKSAERIWAAVSQVWELLWPLGRGLACRATSLLHSHLLCQSLLDHTSQRVGQFQVHDATSAVVTLLATKTHTLTFVPTEPQLPALNPALAVPVWSEDLPLQELVLTGIDMGSELDFLTSLLLYCKRLSILKLGGNCSADVLQAARDCPLTVLHLGERQAWQPRIQENGLAKMLIGCDGSLQQEIEAICEGKQPSFRPFWPDLIDVCTGWCKVSSEFLLLLLITFPKLQQLHSKLIDTSLVVKRYADLARQVPGLHNLDLTTNTVIYLYFSQIYRYFPNATKLHVFNITDTEKLLWELLESCKDLPHVHTLTLIAAPGPVPQPSRFPPKEQFISFGRRITELHIEEHHSGDWVLTMLSLFPSLQHLRLSGSALHIPEETWSVAVFPSISKLECIYSYSNKFLQLLALTFPSLESLILRSQSSHLTFKLPWEQLCEMVWLRDVRLIAKLVDNISGLCCVPRDSSDGREWWLSVAPGSVAPGDLARLRWSGWTCFYINDYR
ncbi:uncharacterized protein LOC123513694 [Portunus trituberculatus]|uniref:uncharacterized protein LOC123513694 n=1 Tax=Portunus trituberculatus TaxID=210409 RepID=UPI001E1D1D08|nr:uncharacterized protein LOC123513694 [Portunus trituberculatus]